ncbi:MAG: DinB family protein [Saprospiraceae bacterium]|nr:DinB family protein [Bacteroidia bacterium]NNL91488.1 DinB family protein [Saprospiraceae bacterium]
MNHSTLLNRIVDLSIPLLNKIPQSIFHEKPSPEKWSKKEILGHLIDSAFNNHRRVMRSLDQNDLNFEGYNQNLWVATNNYQGRTHLDVITLWESCNKHFANAIDQVGQDHVNKLTTNHNFHLIGMHAIAEGSKANLSYLIWDYINHLEHHLSQIIPNYHRINEAAPNLES